MSKFDFVHLHNHTEYSLLDGMISLDTKEKKDHNLFSALKKHNMNAVAITDHGNMFGAVEFYKRCKERDNKIKPIIGSEFYIAPGSRFDKNPQKSNSHIVLLAKSNEGYKNLIKLSSLSYIEGFYYNPRIDKELLEKYSGGLICLSACIAGEIPKLILEGKIDEAEKKALYYRELFGKDSFFLEMQIHGIREEKIVAKALYQMSIKLQIPLVATNDCHYLEREDAEAHDILLCIGTKNKLSDPKRLKFHGTDFYFKSEEEMYRLFKDIPKSLSNTRVIADMCSVDIKLGNPILPDFEVPQGYSKESYLKELSENGLKKRYRNPDQNLINRLNMEIDVINRMGFAGYFLIVWDFINYAKTNNIWVGPGRGSGAGSIVAYSLGITNIDPIKYDLIFERFLNEKRVSMPDFDIDFCQERRQEVIDYVVRKYTKEKVSQIVTFSKMKAKAVIKDVGRVLDVPLSRVNQITKYITEGKDLKKEIMETPELKEIFYNGTDNEKKLLNSSIKLEKLSRHTSVHAAGVVIGKSAITDFVPLQIVKDKINKGGDIITTQYPGPQLEECGLVKMDFLGLITLTLMRNCIQLLEDKGITLDINNIPLDDQKVFELFAKGDVEAIFQFESQGMKKYLMKLRPNCLEDLIAMNALYRPGPMNQIETYIKRKHLEERVEYDHPLVEPILKETYGIMIYQEQVMKISQVVAGYDLGSADLLRRAMGKKKIDEMLKNKRIFVYGNEEERNKIIEENRQLSLENKKPKEVPPVIPGAIKNGLDEKTATAIFEKMEKFAEYGFNKSHAAAYAYVAYQTAYLKAYYPIEFMASVLNSEVGKPDKLKYYVQSLKELNIELLPPDVNCSQKAFSVEDGKIRYALYGIKGVGESAADNIVRSRREKGKYKDYNDFLRSLDL
ncbi:MAG TPA: DNA polymerase III subunit alpha, partial [Spirochaetota bacterium]|nr:DNA polymerase III subunit alpha [Spirochaetota bacterium]